jgi:hypothetical protein
MNITVTIPIVIMEQNFEADVDVSIMSRSRQGTYDNPSEGCEWEVSNIDIRSIATYPGQHLELPIWLAIMIEGSDELAEAITVAENDEPHGRAWRCENV